MGASDWAGRMCDRLESEFDICGDRALRLTTLVRYLRGGDYEGVWGPHGSGRADELKRRLIDELDRSLREQPGDTVEQRWNNLMDDLDCPSRSDAGVYLVPWTDHDADHWSDPGVTDTRPE